MAAARHRVHASGMSPAPLEGVRAGPPYPSLLWPWALVSIAVHAAVFILALFGPRGAGLAAGAGVRDGDGFGGTSIRLEIAGPDEGVAQGGDSAGSVPGIAASPPSEEQPVDADDGEASMETLAAQSTVELERAVPEKAKTEAPRRRRTRSAEAGPPSPAHEGRTPIAGRDHSRRGDPEAERVTAPGGSEQPSGTGAEDSTAGVPAGVARGLILGAAGTGLGDSVTARRALLPNAGLCDDPVAGVWRAQRFRGTDRTWVRFILRIRRQGDALTGTITSRIWRGSPSHPEPGECEPGGLDHTWRMVARGTVDGERVRFGARTVRLVEARCPSLGARYAPDNFTGTIRPFSEIFESLNNDGAFDIDEPYTFRRISCE